MARNVGLKRARGQFIAFLDDDDWWELNKLEEQIEVLNTLDDSWGGVSCKFKLYNGQGQVIAKSPRYKDGRIYKDILSLYTEVTTCSLLLRHCALDDTGYFDENLLRNQEIQLLTQFTFKYKLKLVDKFLLCIDASDNQNRFVDEEKFKKISKDLHDSVNAVISTLTKSELATINSMRDLELAYILFKNKKYSRGFMYQLSIFKSPSSFLMAIKMLKRRIQNRLNRKNE